MGEKTWAKRVGRKDFGEKSELGDKSELGEKSGKKRVGRKVLGEKSCERLEDKRGKRVRREELGANWTKRGVRREEKERVGRKDGGGGNS